ncbi:MAG: hypothetical protein B7Y59_00280 [Burkholderiales bacterium 35-55-47]|jgi:hypothetical protein|uniref:DUF6876 family protein n=1 Tax=Limnohabitans sp. TaxID=1907725 RepID=UPI000BC512B4|nr:DUF6876 family protein [Limnohabitans sp.]OYY19590.1 MAG: hypothetical protein B7Y59_00280 [Burkholderiales bacterium 35-55-47]OYZ74799.1 MAG: hypothetical protein B7Y06_04725 [Burkholderiales bacterium 24-55-52]OZB01313.1 MAG: hypothetical protein B7X62_00280 [Burkholderiales bacterium 39-55-53]HQR85769.1 hypothetical protein [Limnohabitans sp.]HQS26315.1 hypothetical protein [Limnohabitans sp.]
MKKNAAELLGNLSQFIGSEHYYRLLPTFVVTDGLRYLMDNADCYWLAQLYGLHLSDVDFNQNPFTVLKFTRKNNGGIVNIEDGNGNLLVQQRLDYADFPFDEYRLYACWDGRYWVGMLVSEY